MVNHLPEWIMLRYAKLWNKFKTNEFSKEQAQKILSEDNALAVFLSDLRKAGWIEIRIDKKDARKNLYKLKNPLIAIKEEINDLNKNGK